MNELPGLYITLLEVPTSEPLFTAQYTRSHDAHNHNLDLDRWRISPEKNAKLAPANRQYLTFNCPPRFAITGTPVVFSDDSGVYHGHINNAAYCYEDGTAKCSIYLEPQPVP